MHKFVPCSWSILSPSYEDYYWSFIVFLQWHPLSPKCYPMCPDVFFSLLPMHVCLTSMIPLHLLLLQLTFFFFNLFSLDCGLLGMDSNADFSLYFWHSPVVYQFSFGDWCLHSYDTVFNRTYKLNPLVIDLWVKILSQYPFLYSVIN